MMKAHEIKKNIYWVGGLDWDLRNFHGYLTQRGVTYNAYLVIDEKITLIDTVKYYHFNEMVERISSVIDPSKIDYIISNHVEMDHSGSLPMIMEIAKNAEIITSPKGEKGLKAHYDTEGWKFKIANPGETLSTGTYDFNFVLTPMVHWPDNMLTYLPKEKILFSNDAFGQHIAVSERFDDEYPLDIILDEAKKYYANIVMPYSEPVKNALKAALELDIEIIAPSHGFMFRSHIPEIIKSYESWSSNSTEKKAIIVYDSMWESTKKMASAINRAFENKGYTTRLLNLKSIHISDIMTEALDSEYICVGSPTLNNNMLPTVAAFLTYLKGLAPKNRKALAFGSYGWGGQSIGQINEVLASCKFEMLDSLKVQYRPDDETLEKITNEVESKI